MRQSSVPFLHRPHWMDRAFSRPVCGAASPSELSVEIRRTLRFTPMFRVLAELKKRGVRLNEFQALEMFSGTGRSYAVDYAPHVKSVEAWDIDPSLAPILRRNLPGATIRTVDAFAEMRATNRRYDLVFVDPPYELFAGHCEHFDLFPDIFRILNRAAILVLSNVRLKIVMLDRYSEKHLARRREFYGVNDPTTVSFERMLETYTALASQNGFQVKWAFLTDRIFLYPLQKRYVDRACFLALLLHKDGSPSCAGTPSAAS